MNGLRVSKLPSTPWTSAAALGRGRIGVAEMRKSLRQRRLAVHGDRMTGDVLGDAARRSRRPPPQPPSAATACRVARQAECRGRGHARVRLPLDRRSNRPSRDVRRSATWAGQSAFKSRPAALSPATRRAVLTRYHGEIPAIRATSWRHAVAVFGADTAPTGGDRSIRPARAVGTVSKRIDHVQVERVCAGPSGCLRICIGIDWRARRRWHRFEFGCRGKEGRATEAPKKERRRPRRKAAPEAAGAARGAATDLLALDQVLPEGPGGATPSRSASPARTAGSNPASPSSPPC